MLVTRRACGKSLSFVALVCLGYFCGIASKIMLWADTGTVSILIALYLWNLAVAGFDALLQQHYGVPEHLRRPTILIAFMERLVWMRRIEPRPNSQAGTERRSAIPGG
ncbi:MAG: hypothetical protein AAGG47_20845 [Pseudomonadota bacterium]